MSIIDHRSKKPFVLVYIDLLRDPDFMNLSNSAKILYIYLRAAYNPYYEELNDYTGEIQVRLPYKQIEKIKGFTSNTIKKCFDELKNAKFIKIAEQGGLGRPNMPNIKSAYSFVGKYKNFPNQNKKKGKK